MKFLQAFVFLSLVVAVGCTKEGESGKVHFSGDFCELEKRHEGPFPSGKETIVDALRPEDVLVAVNGYPLTKKAFDEVMVLKAKQLSHDKGANQAYLNNQLADFRKNYVPLFVNQRLLIDKARELNVIPKEELERRVNDVVQKQAKARKMTVEKFMRTFPGDFKYFLYETAARLLMNSIVAKHIPPVGEVSDGLVAAFQKSIDEDNAGTMKTNEMKRVQMQEWKRDLLANKVTFEDLAKKYNEDEYADEDQPGYWGEFERGQIDDKRVQSAVFSLKPGEISDPVEDDEGYHLLKVLSVKAPERNDKGRVIQDEMRKVMHIFVKKLPLLIRDTDDILKADLKRQMQIQAINRYLDDLKTNGVTKIEFPHGKKLLNSVGGAGASRPTALLLSVAALAMAAVCGCGENPVADGNPSAGAVVATNVPPEAPAAPLTEEEKEAEKMRDLLDDGQTQAAIRLARNLMDSTNRRVRSQALETLAWIGHRALPEITEMINDADPGIAEEALSSWEQAFSEISGEHRQAATIVETLPKLKKPDPVNAILMHATELDERVALPMLSQIIDANVNFVGECAREMYSHITGGEIYESAESTRRYLEESKKAESKSKPAKQEVNHEAQK